MTTDKKWNCYKKEDKFSIPMRDNMDLFIQMLPEGEYTIRIENKKRKRTLEANAYYWVILEYIAKEVGYATKEELHNTFKSEFLTDRTHKIPIVRSTTRLQPLEFSEYVEKIIQKVAEFNVIVPPAMKERY